jgi:hypothetical protein
MKTIRFFLMAALGFAVLGPATAEAGCRTRVTRDYCGNVLYWEYAFVGRGWDGCPRYDWVVVRRECPPPVYRPSISYGGGYYHGPLYGGVARCDDGGYGRGGYGGGRSGGSSRSRRGR